MSQRRRGRNFGDEKRAESLPASQGTGVYVFSCSRHVHLSSSGPRKKGWLEGVQGKSEKPN